MEMNLRTPKAWRIVTYIVVPPLICLFLFLPYMLATEIPVNKVLLSFIVPVSIGMIAFLTYGLIEVATGVFTISTRDISYKSRFHFRAIALDGIRGYKVNDNYIFILPKEADQKRIKVSTYTEQSDKIIDFLAELYPDLDQLEAQQEENNILNGEAFGNTLEEREKKLYDARKTARLVNAVGVGIAVWLFFFPKPYAAAMITAIAFPVLPLFALIKFKNIITIDERKGSAKPSIIYGLIFPAFGVLLRVLFDYEIEDQKKLWLYAIVPALILAALFLKHTNEFDGKKLVHYFTMLFLTVCLLLYTYGATAFVNCYYDKSKPEIYAATVTKKDISRGKTTSYYLYLTPWGPRKEIDRVEVSKEEYNSYNVDDEVNVYFMQGVLGASWFFISE